MNGDDAHAHHDSDSLRDNQAGLAAADRVVSIQQKATRRNAYWRLFGLEPLVAEAVPDYRAAMGQVSIGAALRTLGPEWTVLHSVPIRVAGLADLTVDHLLIGPPGVVVLTSRRLSGARVWVSEFMVMVNGAKTGYLRETTEAHERVAATLATAVDFSVHTEAVLAIVDAGEVTAKVQAQDAMVLAGPRVVSWLAKLPARLSPRELARLTAIAEDPATWGFDDETPVAVPDWTAFNALQKAVEQARVRRRVWTIVGIAAAFIAVVYLWNTYLADALSM